LNLIENNELILGPFQGHPACVWPGGSFLVGVLALIVFKFRIKCLLYI